MMQPDGSPPPKKSIAEILGTSPDGPTRFGNRTSWVWINVLGGVAFPLAAISLVVYGVVALIQGVPFDPGVVAFSCAWFTAALGAAWWLLFRLGYEVGVDGTTFTWRAPLARATFELTETPLDVWDAANGLGRFRTLRFGEDTHPAKVRMDVGPSDAFDEFLENVRRVQAATSRRSP